MHTTLGQPSLFDNNVAVSPSRPLICCASRRVTVLNLYAGIGGNRKLWENCDVTAIEKEPTIAEIYAANFPNDKIIVGDAHQYLLLNFQNYDFIWSSPPCQTHSQMRQNLAVRFRGTKAVYPDLTLYEEIIFLRANARKLWVVENVKPYYEPLLPAQVVQRHLFWSNFDIPNADIKQDNLRTVQIPELQNQTGFDLSGFQIANKRQILRNCVAPDLGKHVFEAMLRAQG